MNTLHTTIIAAIVFIAACSCKYVAQNNSNPTVIDFSMGISFPPVANTEQMNFTAPLLKELNVNRIRFAEDWSLREPVEGNFNRNPLDERINWAEKNNFEMLLTIQSNGAPWACNTTLKNANSCVYSDHNKFKNYIEKLLQRYPNKIAKIQFGNEWQTEFWYIGNEQQFVTVSNIVYDAIQQFSPNTKFVLGGFTTISLRFLAGCNGLINEFYDDEGNHYDRALLNINCNTPKIKTIRNRIDYVLNNARYDFVDIHLYDDVENWDIYYKNIKSMVQKPIIISEFGGPNVNIESVSEDYQANQLKKYITAINLMDVTEAYFFKLVEGSNNPTHSKSGLIDFHTLSKKKNFEVFKNTIRK